MSDPAVDIYRSMFENAVEGMYRTTPAGDYVLVNPALARMHGCADVADFVQTFGADNPVYVNDGERQRLTDLMQEQDSVSAFETLGWRKDGGTFWMLESGHALHAEDGTLLGYEGVVEDISRLKKAEQELIQARQQAISADRVKTELLSNVGHELRTPLNTIIGFSEIIQKYSEDARLDGELVGYAQDIRTSADQLLLIINDLLEFSQINAGLHRQKFDEVDILALIYSLDRKYSPKLTERGLRLNVDLCRETPALRADERALRRVLEIILSNAIKFTPDDGVIELMVRYAADEGLTVRVTDTGIGFRQEDVITALKPFTQMDSSLTRKYEGMGLGLPIAHNLIDRMGGEFSILTAPEQGTEATICFPAHLVRIVHQVAS